MSRSWSQNSAKTSEVKLFSVLKKFISAILLNRWSVLFWGQYNQAILKMISNLHLGLRKIKRIMIQLPMKDDVLKKLCKVGAQSFFYIRYEKKIKRSLQRFILDNGGGRKLWNWFNFHWDCRYGFQFLPKKPSESCLLYRATIVNTIFSWVWNNTKSNSVSCAVYKDTIIKLTIILIEIVETSLLWKH